jgi:hypothetical protein
MTMTIDELLDSGVKQANHVLVGKPGAELMPAFVIQFKDRPPAMIGTPWNGEDEKYAVVEAIRALLKAYREHVVSYLFWSEAWQAYEDSNHPTGLRPSDRQDRKEVVIINAFDHKGGKMLSLEIMRGPDGVVTGLVANDKENNITALGGRLHNLLQDD